MHYDHKSEPRYFGSLDLDYVWRLERTKSEKDERFDPSNIFWCMQGNSYYLEIHDSLIYNIKNLGHFIVLFVLLHIVIVYCLDMLY